MCTVLFFAKNMSTNERNSQIYVYSSQIFRIIKVERMVKGNVDPI